MIIRYEVELEKKLSKIYGNKIPQDKVIEVKQFIAGQTRIDKMKACQRVAEAEKSVKNIIRKAIGKIDVVESPIEQVLYYALIDAGLKDDIKTQYHIGKYRVDFAIPKANLVIEADGQEYHYEIREQMERDQKRDMYLARKGWRVIHMDGKMIMRKKDECVNKIIKLISRKTTETYKEK